MSDAAVAALVESLRASDPGSWIDADDRKWAVIDGHFDLDAAVAAVGAVIREELAGEIAEFRIICPVHKIPDCSPLLNGCARPSWLHEIKDRAAELVRSGK